jgi:GAF domain-containing protein
MAGETPVWSGVDALAQFLVSETTVQQALQQLVELSAEAVPVASYAGMSLLVEDRVETSVYSDLEVLEIDQAQYDAGEGPCLQSFRDSEVYEVPSTDSDQRWPQFSRAAAERGIRSTLSLPLVAGQSAMGALNFYADREDAFADRDRQIAHSFATHSAAVLANVQAYADAQQLSEQLQEALRSRAAIEQAKGILMGAVDVDADAAFDMLRLASQRENRKLREIAEEIVARRGIGARKAEEL